MTRRRRFGTLPRLFTWLLASAAAASACGSGDDEQADQPFPPSAPSGLCAAIVQQHPIEGQSHAPECGLVSYGTKPPSSGNHYPIWASYQQYAMAIPEGYWVHNLEHGAVVLSYNCADGCSDDVDAAALMMSTFPDDPLCAELGGPVRHRLILTPDPALDVPFAASAWGWTLRANCFDKEAFTTFATQHYGQGPEAICSNGKDFTSSGIPPLCGLP